MFNYISRFRHYAATSDVFIQLIVLFNPGFKREHRRQPGSGSCRLFAFEQTTSWTLFWPLSWSLQVLLDPQCFLYTKKLSTMPINLVFQRCRLWIISRPSIATNKSINCSPHHSMSFNYLNFDIELNCKYKVSIRVSINFLNVCIENGTLP